jgi:hypothetical protein
LGGANQVRIAPRPAEHLDELEAIDRLVDVGADRHGAVTLEQDDRRERLGRFGQGGGDPFGKLGAARDAESNEWQPRDEQGRFGQ